MVTRAPEGAVPRETLWADVLDFLELPTTTRRAMARTEADAGQAKDIAEKSMLAIAEEIRELEAKEERLVELTLNKLITPNVLQKKANAPRAERDRAEQRLAQARNARALALRAGTESASVRRMLASLRQRRGDRRG